MDANYEKAVNVLRKVAGKVDFVIEPLEEEEEEEEESEEEEEEEEEEKPAEKEDDDDDEDEDANKPPPIVPGVETVIEINKGGSGLGLSIVGGSDTLLGIIIIHEVYEDGAAFKDGRLQSGDQVLQVCNDKSKCYRGMKMRHFPRV